MSAPPYMPFYVGDYLADTTHLTTTEHGAYLLLLATMWRAGGSLPNDDGKLARFARLTPAQWSRIKGAIISFFDVKDEVITQGRLAHEMERYSKAVKQRRDAGSRGGTAKALKTRENIVADATVSLKQPEPEPEPISNSDTDVSGDAAEQDFAKQVFDRAVSFLGRYGAKEKDARSFVGRLRKTNSDSQIFEAFSACSKSGVVDPIPWLVAKLNRPKTDLDAAFAAAMQQMGPTQ